MHTKEGRGETKTTGVGMPPSGPEGTMTSASDVERRGTGERNVIGTRNRKHTEDENATNQIKDKYLKYAFIQNRGFNKTNTEGEWDEIETVRGRLQQCVEFWESIGANEFVLDTIKEGYKIPFYFYS